MNIKYIQILTIIIALSLTSCDSSETIIDENGNTITVNTADEAKKSELLNILIDNFNSFSTSSYDAYNYYTRAYGDDSEKIKKTMYVGSTREFVDFYIQKVNDLDKAIDLDVLNELDPLIKEYKNTALSLAKINNEVYQYNTMKDFDNDDFAKAKETHKPLLMAFENFFVINRLLRSKTDSIQNEMEIVYLQKLKADGKTLQYLVGMSLNVSKTMLEYCQSEDYKKLDPLKLEANNKEVRSIYDQLNTFKTEKNDEFKENIHMSFYFSSFKDFVQASNGLTKRVRDKKPYSRGEKMNLGDNSSGWMVDGSVPKLLKQYNSLVDNYNRMN